MRCAAQAAASTCMVLYMDMDAWAVVMVSQITTKVQDLLIAIKSGDLML